MKNLEKLTKIEAEKLALLNMIYDDVEVVCDGYFCYTDNDKIAIVNIDGIEVLSGKKDTLHILGEFAYEYDYKCRKRQNYASISIYNILTNRKAKINLNRLYMSHYLSATSVVEMEGFLFIKDTEDYIVYNNELDNIGRITGAMRISRYCSDDCRLFISYTIEYGRRHLKASLNKRSKKIEYYSITELDDNTSLVAVDKNEKGYSVNYDTLDYYKYKLMKYGVIVGSKSYEDIKKSGNGNTYFIYDFDRYGNRAVGLMDGNGNELIPTINIGIQYAGSNNYVLRKFVGSGKTASCIYNILSQQISADYADHSITIHKTLPLVLIRKPDKTIILDTNGNLFEAKDFYKYFKCSYCSAKPNIIKVELEYGSKYIDNQLTPITNFNTIAALNTCRWIRIV